MEYKEELYQHIFETLAEFYYDKDRFNYFNTQSLEKDELNNSQELQVVYQRIEGMENPDYHVSEVLMLPFRIENNQSDNIFLFDDKKIKIILIECDEFMPRVFMGKDDPKYSSVFTSIQNFVKQKIAMAEKEMITDEIKNSDKIENNKKRRI